jgi:3-hydroxybutyryl-CoA dehydrogenase
VIGVLGAGTMGHGIAHAAAASGFETRLYDPSEAALAKARSQIEAILRKAVDLGKAAPSDADAALGRLTTTTEVFRAVSGADMVIEDDCHARACGRHALLQSSP